MVIFLDVWIHMTLFLISWVELWWSLVGGHMLSLLLFFFWWWHGGSFISFLCWMWRTQESYRDLLREMFLAAVLFARCAYLCGWSLVLHGYIFYMLWLVDSVCLWSFRFGSTHAVGVSGCIWSSSTSLHMELVLVVYGLVILVAWFDWWWIPLRYVWLDGLVLVVGAIFKSHGFISWVGEMILFVVIDDVLSCSWRTTL